MMARGRRRPHPVPHLLGDALADRVDHQATRTGCVGSGPCSGAGAPVVLVRLQTAVAAARGDRRLAELVLRDRAAGREETARAAALFVMIGATPHAGWLPGDILRGQHGFIVTGRDLAGAGRAATGRPVPFSLETSMPGVFAVGDVRAGSVKRVASAVGEGSVATPQVHQHLLRQATRAAS